MKTIYIATHNPHKFKEIAAIFNPIHCLKLDDLSPAPDETGLSFIENALLKARQTCRQMQAPCIADDSGLVVPYLKGEPGIYSARYAGIKATDKENRAKLLDALQGIQDLNRLAYFYCAMVYLEHEFDPSPRIGLGQWSGMIHHREQGQQGFGYDSIFYLPELGQTAAELSPETKNQLSHRAQALKQLRHALQI